MVCDLLYNVLHKGMSKIEVLQLLGYPRRDKYYTHQFTVEGWDYEQDVLKYYPAIKSDPKKSAVHGNTLVYAVGYSASGTNYLILLFDPDNKYIDYMRADAM